MESDCESPEPISFVIRLWVREPVDPDGDEAAWRGQIVDVSSGERRNIRHVDELVEFIMKYIDESRTES
jgi:hypothetical protein